MPELNQRLKNIRLELALLINSLDKASPEFQVLISKLEYFEKSSQLKSIKEIVGDINEMAVALIRAGTAASEVDRLSTALRELAGANKILEGQTAQGIFGGLKGVGPLNRGDVIRGVRQGQAAQLEAKVNENLRLQISKEQELFSFRVAADNQRGIALNRVFDFLKREFELSERLAGVDARRNQLISQRADFLIKLRGYATTEEGIPFNDLGQEIPIIGGKQRNIGARLRGGEDIGIPGGAKGFANFNQQLQQLELTGAKLTGQYEDVTNGVRRFTFEQKLSNGVVRSGEIAIDRLGNVLKRSSASFRGFTDSVIRDTLKFTEWTLAIGLVFLPIRTLQGLMEKAKTTQEALAKATVAVGAATVDTNEILGASVTIAQATGSSLQGVIEGYAAAYAATGGLGSQAQRTAVAQNLLLESMILSKLAGVEQGQALDTLVGILRQTNRELTDGRSVIDSFVAVSRQANVTINSLASAFAIVGTAAEDAGINFDELNGLAAALAESTKLSADETGNAIRGFISGFQSAKAEEVLGRFGIAVRNANGEVRNFTDVFQQLARLKQEGILDESAVREITNAVGGGFRRGAQFATLLENYSRFAQLTTVSATASGEAAEALAIRMDTLETATKKLGNSLTNLATSMGTEGGILSVFTFLTNLLSKIIDLLEGVTSAAGPALTALLAFQGISLLSSRTGAGQFLSRLPAGRLAGLAGAEGQVARLGRFQLGNVGGGLGSQLALGQLFNILTQRAGRGITGLPLVGGAIGKAGLLGAGTAGITAGAALLRGEPKEAAGAIVGAIVGGLIGSATGIGTPIGVAIGSIAGQQFVDTITGPAAPGIESFFATLGKERRQEREERAGAETEEERRTRVTREFNEEAQGVGFQAFIQAFLSSYSPQAQGTPFGERQDIFALGLLQQGTEEQRALAEEYMKIVAQKQMELGESIAPSYAEAFADSMRKEVGDIGKGIAEANIDETLANLQAGKATVAEFKEARAIAPGFDDALVAIISALRLGGDRRDVDRFGKALIGLDAAQREFLTQLAQEASNLTDAAQLDPSKTAERNQAYRDLIDFTNAAQLAAETNKVDLLGVIDFGDISPAQSQEILKKGQELWEDYLNQVTQDPAVIAEIQARAAEQLITIGDGAAKDFLGRTRIPSEFLGQAQEELGYGKGVTRNLLDQRGQLSLADMPALLSRMEAVRKSIETQFPLYYAQLDQNEEMNLILSDGFTQIIGNGEILNLAMQDLIDLNEKQLEGVFNIPEGVTAQIPFTGALTFGGRGGGGGGYGDNAPFGPGEPVQQPFPGTKSYGGAPPSMVEGMRAFLAKSSALEAVRVNIEAMNEIYMKAAQDLAAARAIAEGTTPLGISEYPRGEPTRTAVGTALTGQEQEENQISRWLDSSTNPLSKFFSDWGNNLQELYGEGGTAGPMIQGWLQGLQSLFPESIPVSVKFNLTTQNLINLDGRAISQALQGREYSQFANATRRSGAVGYEVT